MNILIISMQDSVDVVSEKYLHYYLLRNGYDSNLLMMPQYRLGNRKSLLSLENFVSQVNPAFIGISLMSNKYYQASEITGYIKKKFKSIPVIWGGIHPTIAPETCLDFCDYVCIGEGEMTVLEIARCIEKNKSIKNVKNICYIENGKIKRNRLYPVIENLDEIPQYDYVPERGFVLHRGEIVPLDRKSHRQYSRYLGGFYNTIASRGCPYNCTYCCNNFLSRLYSRKVRRRSVEDIVSEVERAVKNYSEIEYVNFLDDCFLACSREYLEEFCKKYKERIGKPFIAKAIPVYLNREKMDLLTDAGLSWIEMGLQTGSDRVCREVYRRKSGKDQFLQSANIIKDYNVAAFYDVILDNPFETEDEKLETIRVLMDTPKPSFIVFFSLTFYMGTEIYEMAKKEFPEKIENSYQKNYFNYRNNVINVMTRLASFLSKDYMNRILSQFEKNPRGIGFRMTLFLARMYSFLIKEPTTYFRVIKRSQRGSLFRTLKVLKNYVTLGITIYINRFTAKKGSV